MAHAHHGYSHSHAPTADSDARRLWVALALILAFMVGEVVTAVFAHSLALLSDAGHMLTDALAIGVSLLALQLMRRPAQGAMTYGLGRVEALSAQFNGAMLLVLAVLIAYEAVRHLISPPDTRGLPVLVVALVGILVNLLASGQLARANRASMNVEGSFQHLLTDLFAFIGTAVAALVILTTGFLRADAIASLLVAALMVRSASGLLRDSGRVFLEAAPQISIRDRSGWRWRACRGSWRCTTFTSGRSPRVSRRFRRTCSSRQQSDCHATRRELQRCCAIVSRSRTAPCRSTTRARTCSRLSFRRDCGEK